MKALAKALPAMVRDAAGIAGAASVVYGVAQVYVPAGYIVGGFFVLAAVFLSARGEG